MHSFKIPADTNFIPFNLEGFHASKFEFPESKDVFKDTKHGFDG
jgi:hypothetical protein